MPPNTVSVVRSGPYGNPFRVGVDGTARECVDLFRHDVEIKMAAPLTGPALRSRIAALKGKNLACYCELDQPCHADVLLELANK